MSPADDAERAVRAGLMLVSAVSDLTHLFPRVGIATGLVVRGTDQVGRDPGTGIVGDAEPRHTLPGSCRPNSVVIAESTRKLLGNLFDLEDLSART
jgi:class 3 adenylate cyclase